MKISPQDHAVIAGAVAAAESHTSGEIRCVLAVESSDHRLSALTWAAAWTLVLPLLAVAVGFRFESLGHWLGGWTWTSAAEASRTPLVLTLYASVQVVLFALVYSLASLPAVRRALTPASRLTAKVQAAAHAQFDALGLTHTRDHTGVLLYVSLAERRAQVLADTGIYAKAPPQVWDEVVTLLVAGMKRGHPAGGFVDAVNRTGEILAACLPPREDDANELPDGLVETKGPR
jgi:putative membrane protein